MRVIPAIDLLNGQVVRLHKGSYEEATIYNDDPLAEAQQFKEAGFDHIHIVDLNGAKEGKFVNLEHIQRIIDELGMSVQTGGGIRTYEDVQHLLNHGIQKCVCSSMVIKNPEGWTKSLKKHPKNMIMGMDLKDGKMAYSGWLETSDESPESLLTSMIDHGLQEVLCTDISRDGTLEGVNHQLYADLMEQFPQLKFIASGGVSDAQDLKKLSQQNVYGVVVGRAYYEDKITLEEMKRYHRN
ncbi:MAG: 1-(5-phosphoribosyl)-5-[(5-phosphoribosylamino)methylideneamino]imidazole-4-carboxamide isomerase [Bacteroidota bacterium]